MFFGIDDNYVRRYASYFGGAIVPHLYYESSFIQLSYIAHDPFNKDKKNFSLFQLMNPGLFAGALYEALAKPKTQQNESAHEPVVFPVWTVLTAAGNTIIYYTPGEKQTDFSFEDDKFFKVQLKPSLLVKNNVDWFVLRKHGWLAVSPGVGLRLYMGIPAFGITATYGYQRSYKIDLISKPVSEDVHYLEVGFDWDFNAMDGI